MCPHAAKQPADQFEEAKHATDVAFATTDRAEKAPVGPDSHTTQQVSHAGDQDHPPSGVSSPDRATSSLQSSSEAAPSDQSLDVHPADGGPVAETAPNEWVLGSDHRPDTAEEDAQQHPGVFALIATHCMIPAPLQMHVHVVNIHHKIREWVCLSTCQMLLVVCT